MASGPKEDDDVAPGMDREELVGLVVAVIAWRVGLAAEVVELVTDRARSRSTAARTRISARRGARSSRSRPLVRTPAGTSKYHIARYWCA
jgi:hypothetical protein